MKFIALFLLLGGVAAASTIPSIQKRASTGDVADIGYATTNGGTTGGSGGTIIPVSTLEDLTAAVAGNASKIVMVSGNITSDAVVLIGSNTSLLGQKGATLSGVGLRVLSVSNVIIRNLIINKVLSTTGVGDAIGIQSSHNVWIDHVDLSSDRDHDNSYYDGLLDITHGSNAIKVSNSFLHDHWKASLVGHSDSNGAEDAAITATYVSNYWKNLNSRTPTVRFGHVHIYNNVYDDCNSSIEARNSCQLLVQYNQWTGTAKPISSVDGGSVVAIGNDFGGASYTGPVGNFTSTPYVYYPSPIADLRSAVIGTAGATLTW